MNKDTIRNILIQKHGTPDSKSSLDEYLTLVLSYTGSVDKTEYCEYHHILSRSFFPEYTNEKWNIVALRYVDHVKAHELLFQSFNNRSYQRTLNFMKSDVAKNSEMISNAAKRGWKNLKENLHSYEDFRKNRSLYMKSLSFEEQSRRANKGWKNTDYDMRCKINKEIWTPELKEAKSEQMKQFFIKNPEESSRRTKKRWNTMSKEDKTAFDEKMKKINQDDNKRQKASTSLKEKWADPKFKEKMLKRNPRSSSVGGYVCVSPETVSYEFSHLNKMVEKFNFNITLIRKYLNTGSPVAAYKQQEREITKNTIGWIFYTMKIYGEQCFPYKKYAAKF